MDSAEAYEVCAREFLRWRDTSPVGTEVVDHWSRTLRRGARIIELACGGGYPISRVLDAAGLHLWAVDSSSTLVAEFRSRFPNIPVQCARVQESDFFGRTYDGAIAIGLLFLLPEPDQVALISRIGEVIVPEGRFLFTAPVQTGTWKDLTTGLECRSLGRERYRELLRDAGFRIAATHTDSRENHYYDAEKVG